MQNSEDLFKQINKVEVNNGKDLLKQIRSISTPFSWFFYNKIIPVDLLNRTNYVALKFIDEDALWGLAGDGITTNASYAKRYKNYAISVKRDTNNLNNVYVTIATESSRESVYMRSKMLSGEPNSIELTYVSDGLIVDKLYLDEHGRKWKQTGKVFDFVALQEEINANINRELDKLEK